MTPFLDQLSRLAAMAEERGEAAAAIGDDLRSMDLLIVRDRAERLRDALVRCGDFAELVG